MLTAILLTCSFVQTPGTAASDTTRPVLLVPDAVWDGIADAPQRGWVVLVRGARIEAVVRPPGSPAPGPSGSSCPAAP